MPPKIPTLINQATQKNTCQNFPIQKKSRNQKFQTPKNPSIIPVTWNPDLPLPRLLGIQATKSSKIY